MNLERTVRWKNRGTEAKRGGLGYKKKGYGSRFDPSNPVVHFRAAIRPDLFEDMLAAEVPA